MGDAPDVMPVHDPAGGHSHRVAVFLAPKVRRGELDSSFDYVKVGKVCA